MRCRTRCHSNTPTLLRAAGDRGERGQGADGSQALARGPEHDRLAQAGDREGVEDGRCGAREGGARQGDDPAAQARDPKPQPAGGAGRGAERRTGEHGQRAAQAQKRAAEGARCSSSADRSSQGGGRRLPRQDARARDGGGAHCGGGGQAARRHR